MGSRGLTRVDVAVTVAIMIVLALVLLSALAAANHGRHGAAAEKCANQLKQIGIAAMQYADDKRYFPHVGRRDELDGGYTTNTAALVFRSLINCNYDDQPSDFVCPESVDRARELTDQARRDIRSFRWEGASGSPCDRPALAGGAEAHDRRLDHSTEISYGCTRRCYSSNATGGDPLLADKAMSYGDEWAGRRGNMAGNHAFLMNAMCVDGHTIRVRPKRLEGLNTLTIASVDSSNPSAGYLGVIGEDDALGR
jgi:hypothetical protein